MPVLFVSHSSKDDAAVTALETWLRANEFTDIFVDHHSIGGGDKSREELRASAGACRVIICLVTENWLASNECFGEFVAACYMGKRIIPLFLLRPEPFANAERHHRRMIAIGLLFIRMLCDCFKPRQQSPEGPPLREMNPRALHRFHCPFQDGLEKCLPPY